MAAKRAIASFRGGAKGLHHMHNGYLADDHDMSDLATGIVFLLEHPDYRLALGEQAYQTINGNYDWDTLARGIEILYQYLLVNSKQLDMVRLRRYLRDNYTMNYIDRRAVDGDSLDHCRRNNDRRTQEEKIMFLEKRRVEFAGTSVSDKYSPDPKTTDNHTCGTQVHSQS